MGTLTGRQVKKIIEVFEDTPSEQVQAILESGLLADLRDANVAKVNRDEFRRICGFEIPPLLEFIGVVVVPKTEKFVVLEKFAITINAESQPQILHLGNDFKQLFFGKVEESVARTKLRYANLTRSSFGSNIQKEVGPEIALSQIWILLERQPRGEQGILITNGYSNIFYVRDANGLLCILNVRWCKSMFSSGWSVGVSRVEGPDLWLDIYRVFSL